MQTRPFGAQRKDRTPIVTTESPLVGRRPSTTRVAGRAPLRGRLLLLASVLALLSVSSAGAQTALTSALQSSIDAGVAAVLSATGTPSASIAIVRDATIVYEHAYGTARLAPTTPARVTMRYSIGSVSKQFTAAAVLLLAEEKKLSLDDKVARWLPELTRASEVSVRQLLSMTAGYQDYWPQDYVFPDLLEPTTPQEILTRWARKPLDFDPGTEWQYSNTNYTIAGLIVERVSGMNLLDFLRQRIFAPLNMTSVGDADAGPLGPTDAPGYTRYGLGSLRPAPKEARGWLFACGQLAMTPHDLALWQVSMINRTLLAPESYRLMQTDVLLANGLGTHYGLGVDVSAVNGRRRISHSGAASGYLTWSEIYPDERTSIVVFTNVDGGAAVPIGSRIAAALFGAGDVAAATALIETRRIFSGLQKGTVDRARLTANASAYFSSTVLADLAASLGPLGDPQEFVQVNWNRRGGMTYRAFRVRCGEKTLVLTTRTLPDGQLEQYLVSPAG